MQKLQGNVQYKDRKDILCSYGVMDDGTNYYFIGEPLSNGNIIASKKLVEAVDPMVAASEVGLIDPDGNVLIPFENRKIKTLSDDVTNILVAERANPVTESVIDANNKKNDPSVATSIVSTQSVIKDKVNALIGPEGRFACNNPFGEASIFDLNGNNLANGNYYSYIAYGNGKVYMTTNVENAEISEYAVLPPEVQANVGEVPVETPIDVNAVNGEAIAETVNTEMDNAEQAIAPEVAPEEVAQEAVVPETVVDQVAPEVAPEEVAQEAVVPEGVAPETVVEDNNVIETQGVAPETGVEVPQEGFSPEEVAPEVAANVAEVPVEAATNEEVVPQEGLTPEEIVAQAQAMDSEENAAGAPEAISPEEVQETAGVDVEAAVPPVVGEEPSEIALPVAEQQETVEEETPVEENIAEEAAEENEEVAPQEGLTPEEIVAQAQAMESQEEANEEVVAEEEEPVAEEAAGEEVPAVDEEIEETEEEHRMTPSEVMAQGAKEEEKEVAEVSPEEVAAVADDNKEDVELDIDDDINDDINDDVEEEVKEEPKEEVKPKSLIDLVDDNDYYQPKEFKADTISFDDTINDFDNSFDDMPIQGASMIENIKAGYEKALDDNARYRNAIQSVKQKYEEEHAENLRLRASRDKDQEIIAQYKNNQDILVTKYKEIQAELRRTQRQLSGLAELNELVESHSDGYVRTGRRSSNYDLDDIISSGRGRRAA